jgi:hypothetical protein
MQTHFDYGFVSADSHVTEPPDCYQRFIDPAYRDRAPFIRRDEKRGDLYVIPGQDNMTVPMGLVAAAGEESNQMTFNGRDFEDWHRSGWDPAYRLNDQARDGVAAELLFATVGMQLCGHEDLDYRRACMAAYNRWLQEYCSHAPDRLFGAGQAAIKNAADAVKRVTQELGGKSANILLKDVDLQEAVAHGVQKCFGNSGQSCTAPSRMFVHQSQHAEALEIAKRVAAGLDLGDPANPDTTMGPVANEGQYDKIQALIQKGIDEGADLVCGGTGKPGGLGTGYYVKPTVFGGVRNDMTIAREEIFGPVLAILPYETEEEAIALANDTEYGLSGCVYSSDRKHAVAVASQLRTGQVHINGANADFTAPFGGYKRSGNGREWGVEGFEEFLETKALMGAYS